MLSVGFNLRFGVSKTPFCDIITSTHHQISIAPLLLLSIAPLYFRIVPFPHSHVPYRSHVPHRSHALAFFLYSPQTTV